MVEGNGSQRLEGKSAGLNPWAGSVNLMEKGYVPPPLNS